jgi:hypothetical protein
MMVVADGSHQLPATVFFFPDIRKLRRFAVTHVSGLFCNASAKYAREQTTGGVMALPIHDSSAKTCVDDFRKRLGR